MGQRPENKCQVMGRLSELLDLLRVNFLKHVNSAEYILVAKIDHDKHNGI